MKIKYCILWFDDQLDKIKGLKMTIQRILSQQGFQLYVDERSSISSDEILSLREKLSAYNPYDLIIFDHDMGYNQTGSSIAAELRASIFTDMVYYSSKTSTDLRKELFDKKIDGVFIAQREHFEADMTGIIIDHTKKICDLNNMRGLVLDFMSDIDLSLRDILKCAIDQQEDKNSALQEFQAKHTQRARDITKKSQSLQISNLSEHIYDFRYVDFNLIRSHLAKLFANFDFLQRGNILESMQDLRNALAHQPYSIDQDQNKFVIKWKGQDKSFDLNEFIEVRKQLLEILSEIEKLKNFISGG